MLNIIMSNQFKRDLKLARKRGLDIALLDAVVTQLANELPLAAKYRDHDLKGDYAGFRECHIMPDWLLIYRIDGNDLMLFLARTGTYSDLFE
ncbi:MAG: type II toxin-antitoxin system YafQ family toxin [Peptococcaceae bacterium]|nr:type II toxin-antitoxin system YafQ family toxin [Peptococcaceae bacterium]